MARLFMALVVLLACINAINAACSTPSPTTVSGTHAPTGEICSGDLIFEDNFDNDRINFKVWSHENTLAGGGNWEFQWYLNSRENSYVDNGSLVLKPSLLAGYDGESYLTSGLLDINGRSPAEECTDAQFYGCMRQGTGENYLNPVKSAALRTVDSFSFKYGKLEVRAKLPAGDWLWPAIWLLPRYMEYSAWPASGEIDVMESRGNRDFVDKSGRNIGNQLIASTLHWGPMEGMDSFLTTQKEKSNPDGYDADYHNYQLLWDEESILFSVDDQVIARYEPPSGGFFEWGGWENLDIDNPWKRSSSKMAPFDQEFYIILNLACGGVGYFPDPDQATNAGGKPWLNTSPNSIRDFWKGRDQWLPTWKLDQGDSAAFKIDYVRVWAL